MAVDLKVNPEYAVIWGDLPQAELEALKESIRIDGLYEKIVVNPDLVILDGHNRYRALKELGTPIDESVYEIRDFGDPLEERLFIIRSQINRRHATPYHRVENALPLLDMERVKAAGRRTANLPNQSNAQNWAFGRATESIGEMVGLGHTTVERALYITKHGSEEMKERLRRDYDYRINNAWANLTGQNRPDPPPLPEGVYSLILADPPWEYNYGGSMRGKAEMHYPTMTTEEIKALPIQDHVAKDAMLFLWTTNPLLKEALEVVDSWFFEYKTNFVWVKDKIGTGFYNRSQHELLLVCRRGNMSIPADSDRFSSVIMESRQEHSEKPEVVYEIIEKMYPNRTYLELFARPRKKRKGWTYWGDEVETK